MSFEQDILRFNRKAIAAMEGTVREAAQDLTMKANTSRFKRGGNTPVVTGFMINSFTGAVNSIPSGRSDKPKGFKNTDFDAGPALLAINKVKVGDRLVLGWTAQYSIYMEARYAFMRSAAQQWPQIAERAARKVRRAIG